MKKIIFKSTRIFVLVLVLTLSTNTNAATSSVIAVPITSTSYANMSTASTKMYALTWGRIDWQKIKDFFRSLCQRCGRKCGGSCGPKTPPGGGTTSIPLDGGLSILALGAAAFGIRKLRNSKKENF
jgi:hypothetical protein